MTPIMSEAMALTLDRIEQIKARVRQIDPTLWSLDGVLDSRAIPAWGTSASLNGEPLSPIRTAPEGFAAALSAVSVGAPRAAAGGPTGQLKGGFVAPVVGARTTQPFGPSQFAFEPPATVNGVRYANFHDGLDLAAPVGQSVFAAADGRVAFAGPVADGAVVVRIVHDDGSETLYGHLGTDLKVRAGDRVVAGEQIGEIGMTGKTTGPHLHFELRHDGQLVDPALWIKAGRLPDSHSPAAFGTGLGTAAPNPLPDGSATLARFDSIAGRIPYGQEIRAAAAEAGIDPFLLASLVRAESNFRANAVSSAGAMGLTQLMPATARSLQVDDPFDPAQNLRGGAKYLAGNLQLYGRVDLALAAYQAGKGAVRAAGGIPDSPTTRGYIDVVLKTWAGYLEGNP